MKLSKLREGVAQNAIQKVRFINQTINDDSGASAVSYGQFASSQFGSNQLQSEQSTVQSQKDDFKQYHQVKFAFQTFHKHQLTFDERIAQQSPTDQKTPYLMMNKLSRQSSSMSSQHFQEMLGMGGTGHPQQRLQTGSFGYKEDPLSI